ncbi:MAG: HopJ type III effector protein [Flavobacterium sp.]|nr:HopJ type III effector protein [Flavobacterium sp.]
MTQQLSTFLTALKANEHSFYNVLAFIEAYYTHQPTAFKNGDAYNKATQNQGSTQVFAFAKLNNFSAADTLLLFAQHYQAVLATPAKTNHQNIGQFMLHG